MVLSPSSGTVMDRPAGTSQSGRCHAPIKPRRPVLLASLAAQGDLANDGTEWWSEPARPAPILTLTGVV